jgi:hypothetical protein
MPSFLHEVVIDMFRQRPTLAVDLLTEPLGIAVPEFQTVRVSPGDLTDVKPTEYRADAVVTLNVAEDPVFAVVVEVQLSVDEQREAKGKAEGKAEDVLAILDARNIPVPDDVRVKIAACTDVDQLDTWIRRAATAATIEDVVGQALDS